MAAVFLAGVPAAEGEESPPALLLSLLYAGLIVLKTNCALFIFCHLAALTVASGCLGGSRRAWLRLLLKIAAWTTIFLAPWVLLHLPLYLAATTGPVAVPAAAVPEPLALLSTATLFFVSTEAHYTILAAVSGLAGVLGLLGGRRRWIQPSLGLTAACAGMLTAALVYGLLLGVLGPLELGREGATRYACPFLIAMPRSRPPCACLAESTSSVAADGPATCPRFWAER